MTYFEYAVKLTDETIEDIIKFGERYGFSLNATLRSALWHNKIDHIEAYVSMTWNFTKGIPNDFHLFSSNIFDACWDYGDGSRGPFTRIVKLQRGIRSGESI